jgi:hypothetical protein
MHGPLIVKAIPTETQDKQSEEARYDTSIYDTPFSKLPNPKRVWLGSPSSALEGIGSLRFASTGFSVADRKKDDCLSLQKMLSLPQPLQKSRLAKE